MKIHTENTSNCRLKRSRSWGWCDPDKKLLNKELARELSTVYMQIWSTDGDIPTKTIYLLDRTILCAVFELTPLHSSFQILQNSCFRWQSVSVYSGCPHSPTALGNHQSDWNEQYRQYHEYFKEIQSVWYCCYYGNCSRYSVNEGVLVLSSSGSSCLLRKAVLQFQHYRFRDNIIHNLVWLLTTYTTFQRDSLRAMVGTIIFRYYMGKKVYNCFWGRRELKKS